MLAALDLFRFVPGCEAEIVDAGKEALLLLLLSFLVAFVFTRLYTRLGRARGWGSGSVGGVHLHHVVPGVILHTTYLTSSRIPGSYTHGYLAGTKPVDVTPLSPTLFGPAGAILSNADDVARFYRALLRGRLVGPDLLKSMQTIDPVATGGLLDAGIRGGGWGLGLLRERFPCGEAWGHDAENPGYMTAAWSSKDGTRQVVVLVNSNFGHDAPVSRAMRKVLASAYCGR